MSYPLNEIIPKIETDGYCLIEGAFDPDVVRSAKSRIQEIYDRSVENMSDRVPRMNRNQHMVYNLQAKDIFFVKLLLDNEIIEGVLKHFLNDQWFSSLPADAPSYILRSYLARSSNTAMPMHIDSFMPYTGSHSFIMQCAILLEDQREENGCTLIVPGSHRSDKYACQESRNEAIRIEAKAGDLAFWDSRIWHGAGENKTKGTRWSMIATFCRWWIKQAFDIPGNLPQEIYDQLTESQKAVLGFCSVPYDDETQGIDMKRSYALLPERAQNYRL